MKFPVLAVLCWWTKASIKALKRRTVATFCVLIGLVPLACAEAVKQLHDGRIEVRDASLAGLWHAAAEIANVNLVAALPSPEGTTTVSLHFNNAKDLLEGLAKQLNMKLAARGRIVVAYPSCSNDVAGPGEPLGWPEKLSLNFERLPLDMLLELLGNRAQTRPEHTQNLTRSRLMLRVKDASAKELNEAITLATGFELRHAGDKRVGITLLDSMACRHDFMSVEPDDTAWLGGLGRSDNCPYRASKPGIERTCDALEYHGLATLVSRGFVQWKDRRYALIEAADQLTYIVKEGSYIGRDFGKVMRIRDEGIDVREIIQDDSGGWVEQPVVLKLGVHALPTQPFQYRMSYIQTDSPQHRYNQAVNDMHVFSQSVDATVELCGEHHPKTMQSISDAFVGWGERNAEARSSLGRHAQAYAERVAQDHAISTEGVWQSARMFSWLALSRYLRVMGDLDGKEVAAYCEAYPLLLEDPERSDLIARFPSQWRTLSECSGKATCPNVHDREGVAVIMSGH